MTTNSPTTTHRRTKRFRLIIIVLIVVGLGLGLLLVQLTMSLVEQLQARAIQSPERVLLKESILFLFMSMAAGIPVVGMGAYLMYEGNRMRDPEPIPLPGSRLIMHTTALKEQPDKSRGIVLMILGALALGVGLVLPIVVWWAIRYMANTPNLS